VLLGERSDESVLARVRSAGPFDRVFDNLAMTRRDVESVLYALQGTAGHYVLTSTGSVYLDWDSEAAFTEDDAHLAGPNPIPDGSVWASYATGKREAERALLERAGTIPGTILRPTIVFGPGDPSRRLAFYVHALMEGRPIGPAGFRFNPVFSADLAAAILRVLQMPPPPGNCYNLAGGDTVSMAEICARLAEILAVPVPELRDPPADAPRPPLPAAGQCVLSIERARRELGFAPTALRDWLATTAWDHRTPRRWPEGERLSMRPLDDSELEEAQGIYERAPAFFRSLGLASPPSDGASDDFHALPSGFPRQRKHYLGIWSRPDGPLVGVADYLDGYPVPGVGWLGLLLLEEPHHGRGLGREACEALRRWAATELGARELRLGVEAPNQNAWQFWKAMGFEPTGETCTGDLGHQVLVMARPAL
jgi:nucleoside-diphosphate-sugar epimerase/GNAT superfamily N-acetyltransferase